MTTFKICGAAPALLLAAALLAAGAGTDDVTAEPCRKSYTSYRVRHYPGDTNATRLWMGYCGLTELNPTEIENLPNVQHLYLESNSLDYINTSALLGVPALTQLSLGANKFREPPVFAAGSCSNLTELFLSYNLLTSVGDPRVFSACRQLERLHLDGNIIEYLHPDVFKSLAELKHLNLENNKIKFIPNNMFMRNAQLNVLWLSNNRLTHLPPEFASSLKRAGDGLKSLQFSGNPWHCACLLEAMADAKRAGVEYYSNLVGAVSVCVFNGAEPCCRRAPAGLLAGAR